MFCVQRVPLLRALLEVGPACLPCRLPPPLLNSQSSPPCTTAASLPQLYSKIRREIMAKEQAAYDGRQAAGAFKPIEREKLEVCGVRCCACKRKGAVGVRGAALQVQDSGLASLLLPLLLLLLHSLCCFPAPCPAVPRRMQVRIREFVRDSIRRYHERKGGAY